MADPEYWVVKEEEFCLEMAENYQKLTYKIPSESDHHYLSLPDPARLTS